eukprot:TRINITY_DN55689_c0_g1_i3.p1 TRINITY_DN55689_c0_g1~~TRINITY_DN55689_c0_g1_i3.p1  ORF type:complete len:108 (+),score=28.41 TRINITY_DN55689_c0_g1_i3:53-376(+)
MFVFLLIVFFFFFKQKTAYEMLRSLVGSEMCIRDSHRSLWEDLLASVRRFRWLPQGCAQGGDSGPKVRPQVQHRESVLRAGVHAEPERCVRDQCLMQACPGGGALHL